MKNLFICIALFVAAAVNGQQVAMGLTASNGVFIGFYQYTPTDYNADLSVKYPLIIFLHGIGERGNGTTDLTRVTANAIPKYIKNGNPMRFYWNGKWETFLVLSPQLSSNYGGWQNFYVDEMIKYAKTNLRIDTNRIILTGLSLGGGGVWNFASSALSYAKQLACIAPVCGTCSVVNACNMANANLPVWAFHALDDATVSAGCTGGAISGINACNPAVKPYVTYYQTGGHGIWDRAYDTMYNWQNPNIYEWFLGQNKSLPVNVRPIAKAGSDITIYTGNGIVSLNGTQSSDADGHIERYIWRKISGPPYGTFNNAISDITTVTGLNMNGTYQYELTVVDDRTDLGKDTVTVTVITTALPDVPPVANAGPDQTITASATNLDGSNSYDPDGTISTYKWTKVSGPTQYNFSDATIASPVLSNLSAGTYSFQLETTDNRGVKSSDVVTITQAATLPMKLIYFTGKYDGHEAQLSWATASEYNNDWFEIESSSDGKSFVRIGSVKGAERSNTKREYSYTDQPTTDVTYYRLKQVDRDGKYEYSTIVVISKNKNNNSVECFPNPVNSVLYVSVNAAATGAVQLKFYDMQGRLLKQQQAHKDGEQLLMPVDTHLFTPGMYLLEVTVSGKSSELKKLIKK